jgi:hypothetical protein
MLVSSLYFRAHTNVGLKEEIPEECNDYDDNDVMMMMMLRHHIPRLPSPFASSTVSKRTKPDTSDLCATLTKFIASRDTHKSDCESMTRKSS